MDSDLLVAQETLYRGVANLPFLTDYELMCEYNFASQCTVAWFPEINRQYAIACAKEIVLRKEARRGPKKQISS